jgi:glycosyltransferase involved in cell wall biosynthesis
LFSFSRQTVDKEQREMVIVHHDGSQFTKEIQTLLKQYKIREAQVVEVSPAPLGTLRNISIENARGALLCQWDDDDIYHPERLVMQSAPYQKNNCIATTLGEQLYWFQNSGDLYIRSSGAEGIPGTVMFLKNFGIEYDASLSKGEDKVLIDEIKKISSKSIYRIANHPELYVRTYHGINTWGIDHFKKLTKWALTRDRLLENEIKIREWAKVLDISKVNVRDSNHQSAFRIP